MFTGIIEEVGNITSIQRGPKSAVLTISGSIIFNDLKIGDSVAVNGVCLTATSISKNSFKTDIMSETLNRSSLGQLRQNSAVNLERAMPINGRFGGHMVSGHIDGMGTIINIKKEDNAIWYTIRASAKIVKYIVEKGSIAIDGISLTVAKTAADRFSTTGDNCFCVSIIPHTAKNTILSFRKVGEMVNLENDVMGKYLEQFLSLLPVVEEKKSLITDEFLSQTGFR